MASKPPGERDNIMTDTQAQNPTKDAPTSKYMLLLYSAEGTGPTPGTPEFMASMQDWFAYTEALTEAGALVGGDPLQGIETATSIQVRDGQTLTTDGPFAETKEILGGYYLIDVANLDDALEWAVKCPMSAYGTVEVRPLMELPSA